MKMRLVCIGMLVYTTVNFGAASEQQKKAELLATIGVETLEKNGQQETGETVVEDHKGFKIVLKPGEKPTAQHMVSAAVSSIIGLTILKHMGGPLNEQYDGVTPLGMAALKGNFEIVKFLCAQPRIQINVRMRSESTPLHAACIGGNFEIIKKLLECGADPTLQDHLGRTPLHRILMKKEHVAAAMMLIDYLASNRPTCLRKPDNQGQTPLHYAAKIDSQEGSLNICTALLNKKVSPQRDNANRLPSHYAKYANVGRILFNVENTVDRLHEALSAHFLK